MVNPVAEWVEKSAIRADMVRLSAYAVEFRYPGETATETDARLAVDIMKRSRRDIRHLVV